MQNYGISASLVLSIDCQLFQNLSSNIIPICLNVNAYEWIILIVLQINMITKKVNVIWGFSSSLSMNLAFINASFQDVFVIDPFSGPAFDKVTNSSKYNCTVVGPRYSVYLVKSKGLGLTRGDKNTKGLAKYF